MDLHQIITTLKQHEADLKARGVYRAAVFGSRARGDNRPDSDTDILIELKPGQRTDIYSQVALHEYVASLFEGPVDVADRDGLKPYIRPRVAADAVYAF